MFVFLVCQKSSEMIVLSVILTVIVIVLCVLYWRQRYSLTAKLLNAFPTAEGYTPIFGHVWHFSPKPDVLFVQFRGMVAKFKETFSFWAGPYANLHIVTAEDAEILLSNIQHIDKGIVYDIFDQWLNKGLLTSTGQKWHQRRKLLTPAFHYNILQMFVDVFGEQCDNLQKIIREECEKPKTNIIPIIKMSTLSTICETSMGIKLQRNDEHLARYYDAVHSIGEVYIKRLVNPILYVDILYNMVPVGWREKKLVTYLHKFTSDIIESREKIFQDKDVINLESTDNVSKKRLAMLDLLIYAKRQFKGIDDEGIREEVDTFVFEGHDTTSVGVSFALLAIANHKDIQKKIIAELDEIFGDSKRHPTYDDLQNMKYLERCLKESLRLYPSVPFIIRNIKEDIQFTKHIAPAGADVWVHIYNVHRDPKYYPDPEKFDPDRFLPDNSKGRHPYAYIPFSAGPRNCIGQKFAMLELKSIVSSILRNYTMEAIDYPKDLTWVVDIVLRVRGPIHIKFNLRNN